MEFKVLKKAVQKQKFKAGNVKAIYPEKISAEISRMLRHLREKKMIMPEKDKDRSYFINFRNNYLLRGVIKMLDEKGFVPISSIPFFPIAYFRW